MGNLCQIFRHPPRGLRSRASSRSFRPLSAISDDVLRRPRLRIAEGGPTSRGRCHRATLKENGGNVRAQTPCRSAHRPQREQRDVLAAAHGCARGAVSRKGWARRQDRTGHHSSARFTSIVSARMRAAYPHTSCHFGGTRPWLESGAGFPPVSGGGENEKPAT